MEVERRRAERGERSNCFDKGEEKEKKYCSRGFRLPSLSPFLTPIHPRRPSILGAGAEGATGAREYFSPTFSMAARENASVSVTHALAPFLPYVRFEQRLGHVLPNIHGLIGIQQSPHFVDVSHGISIYLPPQEIYADATGLGLGEEYKGEGTE